MKRALPILAFCSDSGVLLLFSKTLLKPRPFKIDGTCMVDQAVPFKTSL